MKGTSRLHLLLLMTASAVPAIATEGRAQQADLDHSIWHIKSTLWDDDNLPDLAMIKKRPSGTGTTEVHIYSGASKYRTALVEVGTALPYTGETWEFAMADWDLDGVPDLWAINRNGRHHKVEVSILSGALFFRQFLVRTETAFDAVGPEAEFLVIPPILGAPTRPNLMMVQREHTGTHVTEIHVIDGGSNFKKVAFDASTPLPETGTGPGWQFQAGDYDGDRVLDLLAVTSENGGAFYVVSGKSNLKEYALRGQLVDAGAILKMTGVAPDFAELEPEVIAKLEAVAADPKVPAGVGPKTTLMSGTYAASALAEMYCALGTSQAVRQFRRSSAVAAEGPRPHLRTGTISERLQILPLKEDSNRDDRPGARVSESKRSGRGAGYDYQVVPVDEDGAAQLARRLEQFDRDGWEVVGTIGGRSVILKRPRQD